MILSSGAKLGPYELIAPIGAGGMGEVWKARDTRLGRDVAMKFSAQQFSDRFEREARAVAALNHPNICTLHDVGPDYLVLELIDGTTLAERIARGPIPLDEALSSAGQIADAIAAAHDREIVHRDLKPANIKIRPDGSVKVLDFGLSKSAAEPTAFTADSPTMLSAVGMILGTAGYMSPEQARGQETDKRADIWAFGVVLYEMLTGERLFEGKTVSDALAAVLMREPDLEKTPVLVRRLLRACLEKDPKRRLHDIADWKLLLEETAPAVVAAVSRSRMATLGPWVLAACLFAGMVGLGWVEYRHRATQEPGIFKVTLPLPENASIPFNVAVVPAVSPDGKHVAFSTSSEGNIAIWVRDIDSFAARLIPGTEGGRLPFWSPDSRTIAFFEDNRLMRIAIAGGAVLTICEAVGGPRGGTWAHDGNTEVILFAVNAGGIFQVNAAGGTAVPLIKPNPATGELNDQWPWFLPDGHHFLYSAQGNQYSGTVYVADMKSGERKRLAATPFNAIYASGHLIFVRDGNLMAQAFDSSRLQTTGDATPIAEAVGNNQVGGLGFFTASGTGLLAYFGSGGPRLQLNWFDRSGKHPGIAAPSAPVRGWASISPDSSTMAFNMADAGAGGNNLWLFNVARAATSRFTSGSSGLAPVFSPDGRNLAFSSSRDGVQQVFVKALDGGKDELLSPAQGNPPHGTVPEDWSRDGRYLVVRVIQTRTKDDIWIQPLFGDRKAFPYLEGDYNERNAGISPDGKWIVYSSDETGKVEIYAQSFPTPGGKIQISTEGGERPKWSHDGKEIFFIAPDRRMMAVLIKPGATLEIGRPQALFETRIGADFNNRFDVSEDGRFLIPVQQGSTDSPPLNLIVNWPAILKK
jgi:eukaryotic-like serine/threonine-protein kinase